MSLPKHHLATSWHLRSPAEAVFDVISRPVDLPLWWPATFPEVLELDPGDERSLGSILRLEIRGWLPYILNCHVRVLGIVPGQSLSFEIWGDVSGTGVLTTLDRGEWTELRIEADFSIRKSPVRNFSRFAPWLFAANHGWATEQGREGLIAVLKNQTPGVKPEASDLSSLPNTQSGLSARTIAAVLLASMTAMLWLKRRGN